MQSVNDLLPTLIAQSMVYIRCVSKHWHNFPARVSITRYERSHRALSSNRPKTALQKHRRKPLHSIISRPLIRWVKDIRHSFANPKSKGLQLQSLFETFQSLSWP
ncbi:uncharacterized protein AKAW2_61038A [Aspergillus luchuensis]|uniref:Uncharacterized protein n=1 Tax=Aspergillus kawachii TaxID=1069201 RepID=A0A7R7WHT2_ASPKA|nr:uncharacterized protein AKAW2_61038A [Aspergillus luchuensis]BCS02774.1 hypothetical protein AKAW2_61038A [Aspergillus luchuensis]